MTRPTPDTTSTSDTTIYPTHCLSHTNTISTMYAHAQTEAHQSGDDTMSNAQPQNQEHQPKTDRE